MKAIRAPAAAQAEESLASPEAQLWGGMDMDRSLEVRAAEIEGRLGEQAGAEKSEADEAKEHAADVREANERGEKGTSGLFKLFTWQKQGQGAKPEARPALQKPPQEALKKQDATKPAFGQPATGPSRPGLTAVSASRLQAAGQVKNKLAGASANPERPPDAFALLKEARERGVLFVEDALQEGHSEDREDPELAAAVEECIRLCFGVRGILRIGPGRNDAQAPIIVVATTHGFTDASLAKVPESVHRFPTLIAIPFDLLPLKRER